MAPPPEPPPRPLVAVLRSGHRGGGRPHVLVEAQLPARAKHPASLGEGAVRIRDGAQDEPEDDSVERAVGERQAHTVAVADLDWHRCSAGTAFGALAHAGFGLERHDASGLPVQGKILSRPSTDLENLPLCIFDEPATMLFPALLVEAGRPSVIASGIQTRGQAHGFLPPCVLMSSP